MFCQDLNLESNQRRLFSGSFRPIQIMKPSILSLILKLHNFSNNGDNNYYFCFHLHGKPETLLEDKNIIYFRQIFLL